MKRAGLCFSVVSVTLLGGIVSAGVAGCGASSVKNGGDDAAAAGGDLAGTGDDGGSALPDLSTFSVPGTQIAAGNFDVRGVTADDQVIAFVGADTSVAQDVVAVPLAGGKQVTLVKAADSFYTDGSQVFIGVNVDGTSGVGQLWTWNSKLGAAKKLDDNSLITGVTSADGAWIAWTGAAAGDGSAADIFFGKSDGSGATKQFAGAVNDQSCSPVMRFAANLLLVSLCSNGDGGTSPATVQVVDPGTGKATTLSTDSDGALSVTKAGDKALIVTQAGAGIVYPLPTGPAIMVGAIDEGYLLPDGSAVIYVKTGVAYRFPLPAGPALKLTDGVSGLTDAATGGHDRSDDGKWLIIPGTSDPNTGLAQLQLMSTQAPAKLVQMNAATTGAVFGDPFTVDSSRAVFFTITDTSNNVGPLHAQPVAGGAVVDLGAKKAFFEQASKGSSVVWSDSYVPGAKNMLGKADILVGDASKADPGKVLAARADEDFALSTRKDKLVFTSSVSAATAGIYTLPLP